MQHMNRQSNRVRICSINTNTINPIINQAMITLSLNINKNQSNNNHTIKQSNNQTILLSKLKKKKKPKADPI